MLLADELEDSRVLAGTLGCSNCRERYPVEKGFVDLRSPPRQDWRAPEMEEAVPSDAVTLGALLGVTKGPGEVALLGLLAEHGHDLAALVPGIEVVCIDGRAREAVEEPGVSRLAAGRNLPFFSGVMRGVALVAAEEPGFFSEPMRILARGGRLVVLGAEDGMGEELAQLGFQTVLQERGTVVARRP